MRIHNKTAPVVFLAILTSAFALAFMTADEFYVAAPGLACVIIMLWLWFTLWDRDQRIPFFDVGMLCALATLVYTVYPLVNYWVGGFQFGILSDGRLSTHDPDPLRIGYFHLRHVLYMFSFVFFYLMFRGRGTIEVGNVSPPGRSTRQVIVIFFLTLTGYFFLLQLTTGINFNASYESDAFESKLAAIANAPLLLLQISGKLAGILFVFKLALLYIVVSRCRQKKWLIILLVWIIAEIVQAILLKGARTGLVLFMMATALFYHRMIKPLSMKSLITLGAILFLFFNLLGLYRSYMDISSLHLDLSQADASILSSNNEFQSMLGTAYDVLQRKADGAHLPWYLYINDFINILPPQQLMPFEKVDAPEWYLREIGVSETGQGYMWGVITQSVAGLDWLELALRGAILGYILARIHRWYLKHQSGFLETLFYVYLCLNIYYTFRNTTGSILGFIVWEIIPVYIILQLGATILRRSKSDTHGIGITATALNSK